jgi:phage terminase large subunit GpA-like protein
MSSSELHTLQRAFTAAGGKWSTFVIWAKNTFTLGRADYQRQYEPILYGWVRQHPQASWGPAGAAARQPRTAVAVKGRDQDTALLLSVSKADAGGKRRGLRVWSVGTPVAKGELYRWLKLEWPTEEAQDAGAAFPPGACHFPQYREDYFKQLTTERLVTRIVKGFPRGSWEKEPGRRNEALDCRVYARAAAAIYGLDRFEERHWRRMDEALAPTAERDDHNAALPGTPVVRPPARRVIHSGYMAR